MRDRRGSGGYRRIDRKRIAAVVIERKRVGIQDRIAEVNGHVAGFGGCDRYRDVGIVRLGKNGCTVRAGPGDIGGGSLRIAFGKRDLKGFAAEIHNAVCGFSRQAVANLRTGQLNAVGILIRRSGQRDV